MATILFLCVILATFTGWACPPNARSLDGQLPHDTRRFDIDASQASDDPTYVTVQPGEVFALELRSNPGSTGYSWQPPESRITPETWIEPLDSLTFLGCDFTPGGGKSGQMRGMVGAPGVETWVFRAPSMEQANITVYLDYARPWEPNLPALSIAPRIHVYYL